MQIQIPVEDYVKLTEAFKWYQAMPNSAPVGDTFHENMALHIQNLVGDPPNEDYYFSHIGTSISGDITATFLDVETGTDEIIATILPSER